ncbi:MAG: MurR/RpiR family transcriptional regulator [Oscillospiraceae bacterium]|nr:MurR/RpiR family transcriptional regulator [Oscillospiraceae bacterium]
MENDVLAVINAAANGFSKGQRRIAKYITDNYDKAAFMTAGKLGATVGVSESTVVRFAAELGYDGYPDMRKALQEMIKNRLTSVQRIEVAKGMTDNTEILTAVLSSDIDKIRMTLEEVKKSDFYGAVDAIVNAEHIYILGLRSSAALANFLGFYLNLLLPNVRTVRDSSPNEILEQILRVGEGDVFIGISFPRYSRMTIRAMQFAHNQGAKVVSITDTETSLIAKNSDIKLYAKSDMLSFLDSLVAPLSLINALIVAVANSEKGNLSEDFERLEKLWSEYAVYGDNEM